MRCHPAPYPMMETPGPMGVPLSSVYEVVMAERTELGMIVLFVYGSTPPLTSIASHLA